MSSSGINFAADELADEGIAYPAGGAAAAGSFPVVPPCCVSNITGSPLRKFRISRPYSVYTSIEV